MPAPDRLEEWPPRQCWTPERLTPGSPHTPAPGPSDIASISSTHPHASSGCWCVRVRVCVRACVRACARGPTRQASTAVAASPVPNRNSLTSPARLSPVTVHQPSAHWAETMSAPPRGALWRSRGCPLLPCHHWLRCQSLRTQGKGLHWSEAAVSPTGIPPPSHWLCAKDGVQPAPLDSS